MMILLSAAAFLFLLTVLILLHECGHFLVAKRAGVVVEEFGFGLPPRAKELFRWGGTIFSLNWVPFGGFVRLRGESAVRDAEIRGPGSFGGVSITARVCILVAGVFMNFLLAFFLFTLGFSFWRWIPTYLSVEDMRAASSSGEIHLELGILIEGVQDEGGAAAVGVPSGSLLIAVDGNPVTLPEEVTAWQEGKTQVAYTLLTGEGRTVERELVIPLRDGKAGVVLSAIPRAISAPQRSIFSGLTLALRESRVVMSQTVAGMVRLFISLARTGAVPEGVTGIVGIAQLTHSSVQEGLMTYLRLIALLSLSLAVLNILPLPALDGGRLLFVLFEAVSRRPTNRRFELAINSIGFVFLLLLILVITFYDLLRLFR